MIILLTMITRVTLILDRFAEGGCRSRLVRPFSQADLPRFYNLNKLNNLSITLTSPANPVCIRCDSGLGLTGRQKWLKSSTHARSKDADLMWNYKLPVLSNIPVTHNTIELQAQIP